jgi:glycosyltransferase involved in cell wall biosynthesis
MPALRLMVLTTSYPLTEQSYSGIFVRRMLEHLPDDTHVTVVAPAARTQGISPGSSKIAIRPFRYAPKNLQLLAHEPGGIPVTLRSKPWAYALLPLFLFSMLASCFRHARRADVIHANWSICGLVAGIVGKFLRVPVITTLRGEDVTRAHNRILDRAILSLCLRLSTRIVTVSPSTEARLRKRYPELAHKINTVENGIGDELLKLPEARVSTSKTPLRLLTVGSLIPRKGIRCIIEAIGRLPDPPRVRLTIAGSGPERMSLGQLVVSLNLSECIEFIGAVEPQSVADLLAHAEVFILASRSEGRPNVILEAMAAALPVIATDIDGVRDIVEHEHTGLLYEADNNLQLSGHIARLCDDEDLRRRLGQAARRWIIQHELSWTNTARRYANLYRALAGETVAKMEING